VRYAGEIANTRITKAGARRAGSIEDRSRIQKEKSLSGTIKGRDGCVKQTKGRRDSMRAVAVKKLLRCCCVAREAARRST
jgi:hypothetical protein